MNNLPKIENMQTLIQAFEQIAQEHTQINSFLFGNYFDLATESRSKIIYPALLLELPNVEYSDNGADHRSKGFSTAFILLNTKTKNDTKLNVVQKLDNISEIMDDIISRLYSESTQNYEWYFNVIGQGEIIDTVSQDADIGMRYEFVITRRNPIINRLDQWN